MSDAHEDATIAVRVRRLEERLVEAGIVTEEELEKVLQRYLVDANPLNGARAVARAWIDPAFRDLLLADPVAALAELGISDAMSAGLKVVANEPDRHNVIVCTLCSCYPVRLLGPSPGWYRSLAYRARVVREPRAVLAEFGLRLPEEVDITVWDSTSDLRYMVLPLRPAGAERLSEAELTGLVTREGLIGTAAV